MISIKDRVTGVYFTLEGKIERLPKKLSATETMTNLGQRKKEFVRAVIDINIVIDYISDTEYNKLEDIFMSPNISLDVVDNSEGKYFSNYYIIGDSISFEKKEDIEKKSYFYIGALQLGKR